MDGCCAHGDASFVGVFGTQVSLCVIVGWI
jgi:hypothetical protein